MNADERLFDVLPDASAFQENYATYRTREHAVPMGRAQKRACVWAGPGGSFVNIPYL